MKGKYMLMDVKRSVRSTDVWMRDLGMVQQSEKCALEINELRAA